MQNKTAYKGKFTANGLKIAAVYASIILGAGFASGQELIRYFVSFGTTGLIGLFFAGAIFAFVGWSVLEICRREEIKSYSGLMKFLLGEKLGALTEWMVVIFLFCLFVAMLAGAGALGQQAFRLPFTAGALIVGLIVYAVILFGLEGIVKINVILAPVMILGGIFIGLFSFFMRAVPSFVGSHMAVTGWIISAVVYASYNLVTGIPVLAATSRLAETKRDAKIGGVCGGAIIALLGLCMALPLLLYYTNIISAEIPFLIIAAGYGIAFSVFYIFVLVCALFTTAACNAFAVLEWLQFEGSRRKRAAAALVALGVIAAHVGFSNIVMYVYPIFGLVGLFKNCSNIIPRVWASEGRSHQNCRIAI